MIFILFAGILTFGLVAAFVIRGFGGGLDFLAVGWQEVRSLVAQAFGVLTGPFVQAPSGRG